MKYSDFTLISALFALSLFLRIIFYIFYDLSPHLIPDTLSYTKLGFDFFNINPEYGQKFIFGSDIHMPGYSLLSFLFNGRENLILFDIFLSSLTSILIFLLCEKLFNKKIVSFISALLFSFNPFLIFFSISGLTETSYIFMLILFCLLMVNEKYIFAFIVICLSIYLRPTIEIFYPIIIIAFLYFYSQKKYIYIFKKISIFFFIYILVLSPWWVHNYVKFNEFVRINFAPSYSLFLGNNEFSSFENIKYIRAGKNTSFDLSQFEEIKDPITKNKEIRNHAINFIFENPDKFVILCINRFIHFWQLYPNADEYQNWKYILISCLSFGSILLFSFIYLINLNISQLKKIIPLILIILSINLVHVLTISSLRYRLPIEPFLIIFAANGLHITYNFILKNYKK